MLAAPSALSRFLEGASIDAHTSEPGDDDLFIDSLKAIIIREK
jgi:hypothetical protein